VKHLKPFISFYDSIGFAPTRQDSAHAETHDERRAVLYRSLGIPSIAIRGSRVIEFGPGSGENCESVMRQKPSHYTLVDGSRAVLDQLRERLGGFQGDSLSFSLSDIHQYSDDDTYDLVICEGVLPMQQDPKGMANHVMQFARPGGVVVMTCFDSCSSFSEWCRRFIAQHVFGDLAFSMELVEKLTGFFGRDLSFLPGMSRQPGDWVIDTLINPWVGQFFSLRDALDVSSGQAEFLGSSPRFFQDWRWYKDPSNLDNKWNLDMIDSELRVNSYMFLDRRITRSGLIDGEVAERLSLLTTQLVDRIRQGVDGGHEYSTSEFGEDIEVIAECVRNVSDDSHASLQGLVRWAASGNPKDLDPFRSMWGRGQQFISVVKTSPVAGC
jgi:ubiquinone/menaquinone biosynthesis C-methylase UbiE